MTITLASSKARGATGRSLVRLAAAVARAGLLGALAVCVVASAGSAAERRKVLVLYSYNEWVPWQARIHAGLQQRLEAISPEDRPDLFEERLDSTRIDPSTAGPAMTAYLRAKYANFTFDAVIAESYGATRVLLGAPDLFAGARRYAIDPGVAVPAVGGGVEVIETQSDWARPSLLNILDVMPETRRIVAIVDHSAVGQNGRRQLLAGAAALPATVRLDVWDDFTFDGLLDGVATLPPSTAVFYMPVFKDRTGAAGIPRDLAHRLAAASSVPVFAAQDTFLNTGIAGGRLLSAQRFGEMMADLAMGGSLAEKWRTAGPSLNPYMFDEAALRRWHLRRDLLPEGSILIGSDVPLWERYPREIVGTLAVLILEGCLILWLVRALTQRDAAVRDVIRERDGLEWRVAERTRELSVAKDRLEASNVRLQGLADTDALTAAASRRKFLDTLHGEGARAVAEGAPLCLLMLDIDRFKSINDGHGHAAGDLVIRAVADTCRSQIGPADCLGRLGGEEFAILLPGTAIEAATACAERILAAVRAVRIAAGTPMPLGVTVSIGVSQGLGAEQDGQGLILRADAALYRAKQGGRDQVVVIAADGRDVLPRADDAVTGFAVPRAA